MHQRKLFFVGIGGISMASLAAIARQNGAWVKGYDKSPSALTHLLQQKGIEVFFDVAQCDITDCDAVIYTLAVPPSHPLLVQAQKRKIPIVSRPDYLGAQMNRYRNRICVAGSHGKSTTTAMLHCIYQSAQRDPTTLCGAQGIEKEAPYRMGGHETLLLEACEYRDAFLSFCPTTALLLNLELDHVDYFSDFVQLEQSFATFAKRAEQVVYCADDSALCRIAQACKSTTSYALSAKADYTATDLVLSGQKSRFCLCWKDVPIATVKLQVGGRYNVQNALAAAALAHQDKIPLSDIVHGLQSFCGIGRRMEYLGAFCGAAVYCDYAHHPTELRAVLPYAKELAQQRGGRLVCVFQSHTHSRSAAFLAPLAEALQIADERFVLPTFGAREESGVFVSAQDLAQAANGMAVQDFAAAKQALLHTLAPNDLLLLLGAGDVNLLWNLLNT